MAPIWTERAYWTVEDAAQLLRVNKHSLYRACQKDFPHIWVANSIRIPAEALLLTVRTRKLYRGHEPEELTQLAFEFDVPILPVARYRNGERITRQPFYP